MKQQKRRKDMPNEYRGPENSKRIKKSSSSEQCKEIRLSIEWENWNLFKDDAIQGKISYEDGHKRTEALRT